MDTQQPHPRHASLFITISSFIRVMALTAQTSMQSKHLVHFSHITFKFPPKNSTNAILYVLPSFVSIRGGCAERRISRSTVVFSQISMLFPEKFKIRIRRIFGREEDCRIVLRGFGNRGAIPQTGFCDLWGKNCNLQRKNIGN
jgi:hypothetical protein